MIILDYRDFFFFFFFEKVPLSRQMEMLLSIANAHSLEENCAAQTYSQTRQAESIAWMFTRDTYTGGPGDEREKGRRTRHWRPALVGDAFMPARRKCVREWDRQEGIMMLNASSWPRECRARLSLHLGFQFSRTTLSRERETAKLFEVLRAEK